MSEKQLPVDEVTARIQQAAAGTPYPVEAFRWVLRVIQSAGGKELRGQSVCWLLRSAMLAAVGRDARRQLAAWSIHTTADFGKIVFRLVDAELMVADRNDSIDDFLNVFDFEAAFPAGRLMQWRLSTIFLIMTVAAVAFAGAGQMGLRGALGTMFGAWMCLIGSVCLYLAARNRAHGRWVAVIFGAAFLVAGATMFLWVILWTTKSAPSAPRSARQVDAAPLPKGCEAERISTAKLSWNFPRPVA